MSTSFSAQNGHSYKCHSWELREGGYRKIALLVGDGVRPVDQESRLLSFLLERSFRIVALDLAYGAQSEPGLQRPDLRAFREAMAAFASANEAPSLPFYVIAQSFSAGALLPVADVLPTAAAWALIAPVVEFPPRRLKRVCFLSPYAELDLTPQDLCGDDELLADWRDKGQVFRFRMSDMRLAASDLGAALETRLDCPVAAFAGEADPFLTDAGRVALKRGGARLYGYPRVKHDPGRDRYSDNYYADLGAFLDEVEAGKAKR
jgi:hypothetical protein